MTYRHFTLLLMSIAEHELVIWNFSKKKEEKKYWMINYENKSQLWI